jgi:hypothetical protein
MINLILLVGLLFGISKSALAGDDYDVEGQCQAYKSIAMNESSVCFVYFKSDSEGDQQILRVPDGIAIYTISKSKKPELVYEFPYAGTKGKIEDVFFLFVNDSAEKALVVIHSMQSPRSWDTKGDVYDVSVLRNKGGEIIRDERLSRFFNFGGDVIDAHGLLTYLYPYKDKKSIEGAIRSPLFRAFSSSAIITGTVIEKTFLYSGEAEPASQDPNKSYLVKGDRVTLEDSMAGWCKVSYKAHELRAKWMQCRSIAFAENDLFYAK